MTGWNGKCYGNAFTRIYFPKVLGDSTFLGATHDRSSLLPLLAILVIASHSVLAILLNVYWLSHRDSIFIFLKTNDRY